MPLVNMTRIAHFKLKNMLVTKGTVVHYDQSFGKTYSISRKIILL